MAPLAIPFALNLPLPAAVVWCLVHAALGALEGWRAGFLMPGRRTRRISRNGPDWRLTRGDGLTCAGELRRAWASPWCVYLELRGEGWWPWGTAVLVWCDAVDPVGFRHLRTHIRVG